MPKRQDKKHKNRFQWKSPIVDVEYSFDADGEPDIDRMIEQKPFWKKIVTSFNHKPKKIVITDWSVKLLKDKSLSFWEMLLKEGLEQGAEFYVWTGKPTKVKNFEELKIALTQVEPITSKELLAKLSKEKIAKDETEIIDFISTQLIKKEFDYYISSLGHITKEPFFSLKDFLPYQDKFSELLQTFYSNQKIETELANINQLDLLKTAFTYAPQINALSLSLRDSGSGDLDTLITELEKQKNYPKIQFLKISMDKITAEQLERLLALFPNLENLELNYLNISEAPNNLKFNLSKLKNLLITSSQLTKNLLEPLVNSAHNLEELDMQYSQMDATLTLKSLKKLQLSAYKGESEKKLIIHDCDQLTDVDIKSVNQKIILKPAHQFTNLKTVSIENSISSEDINELLKASPNLNRLVLITQNKQTCDFAESLASLDYLRISQMDMKDDEIIKIIKATPGLKDMDLDCCTDITGLCLSQDILPDLETISLNKLNLQQANLANVFRHAKKIILKQNELPALPSDGEIFAKVESIEWSMNYLSDPKNLALFLESCPNLKDLSFSELANCKASEVITKLKLPKLEKLNLFFTARIDLTEDQINQILKNNPNLKSLEIDEIGPDTFDYSKIEFNKNTKLVLNNTVVSKTANDAKLKLFLSHCTNLQKLDLSNNQEIKSFYDESIDFSDLNDLDLSNTNITANNLNKILLNAPKLSILRLSSCNSIANFINEFKRDNPNRIINLTQLNLSDTSLTLQEIRTIIETCPSLVSINLSDTNLSVRELEDLSVEYRNLRISFNHNVNEGNENKSHRNNFRKKKKVDNDFNYSESNSNGINGIEQKSRSAKSNSNGKSQQRNLFDKKINSKTPLEARQIFAYKDILKTKPWVNSYRLEVFDKLKLGNEIEFAKTPRKIKEVDRFTDVTVDVPGIYSVNTADNVFLGQVELELNDSEWTPLPSLSTNERVLKLSADIPLQLGYCEEEAMYYVKPLTKTQNNHKSIVSFLLRSNEDVNQDSTRTEKKIAKKLFKDIKFSKNGKIIQDDNFKNVNRLNPDEKIQYLAAYCRTFSGFFNGLFGGHELVGEIEDDIDGLNAMIQQRQGACRHRAWVFKALADELGIKTRIVSNDCHMFVEVYQNNKWVKKDLGGHFSLPKIHQMPEKAPAKENVNSPDPNKESKQEEQPPTMEQVNTFKPRPSPQAEKDTYKTWDTVKSDASNFKDYFKAIIEKAESLPENQRNILITVEPEQMELFHQCVTQYYNEQKNNCYYLDSLNQITEKSASINKEGQLKKINSQFISHVENAKPGDAIISNWSDYKSAFVGYNSMMDKERKVKGTPIPDGALVICVLDKTEASRMGEDFYSRLRIKSECIDLKENDLLEKLQIKSKEETKDLTEIEFYDDDWKKYLLGKIAINGKHFNIEQPQLVDAINAHASGVLLTNAPWHLKEFRLFISELMIKRKFYFNGAEINLPENFQIKTCEKEYNFQHENLNVEINEFENNADYHLNNATFSNFFRNRRCEKKQLYTNKGWLELNAAKTISIYVTETLTVKQWAHLLSQAKKLICELNIKLAPNVTLPTIDMLEVPVKDKECPPNDDIIITDDLEFAEEKALEKHPGATVISVNIKTTFGDLFEKTKPENVDDDEWKFNSTFSSVWKKLTKGKTVILKGTLSPTLARQMETLFNDPPYLWINGERKQPHPKSKLILISDNEDIFTYRKTQRPEYTQKDYWTLLEKEIKNDKDRISFDKFKIAAQVMQTTADIEFSYGQLRDMFIKIKNGSLSNPFKPYYRLIPDTEKLQLAKKAWKSEKGHWKLLEKEIKNDKDRGLFNKFKTTAQVMQTTTNIEFSYDQLRDMLVKIQNGNLSNPFEPYYHLIPDTEKLKLVKKAWENDKPQFDNIVQKRQQKLINEFKKSPFIFIAGASGIGKSTHILNELKKEDCHVSVGIENIKEWINDKTKTNHVLFIDEANLEPDGAWDILEGLFNKTPGILIDGKFHPLTPNHKLIFAGNYNTFAGRHQHKFFERHGQVFNFKELPKEDIIKLVIEPALKNAIPHLNENEVKIVTKAFYSIYQKANNYFSNHPATLRNLSMMAMRLALYLKADASKSEQLDETELKKLAKLIAVDELSGMVDDMQLFLQEEGMVASYRDFKNEHCKSLPSKLNDFIVTDSRRNPLRALHELFRVRDTQLANPDLKDYTLPGFLIEGPAGIGKSKMAIEYLRHHLGYTPGDIDTPIEDGTKRYYHITPTDPEKMKRTLVKAFHEGSVVIIDELNSLPLERILNQLMSGKDLNKDPKRKGFMVIATQNPASFTGRQVLSPALENRFNKIYLDDYPLHELKAVCYQICPNKEIVDCEVADFISKKSFAKLNGKYPEPTARDLFEHLSNLVNEPDFVPDRIKTGKEEVFEQIPTTEVKEATVSPEEITSKQKNDNDVDTTIVIRMGLIAILNRINNHEYNLHGGGVPATVDGKPKQLSQAAFNIKNLIEATLKNKKLTDKSFERVATEIAIELQHKRIASEKVKSRFSFVNSFFNIGNRAATTVNLYKGIDDELINLETELNKYRSPKGNAGNKNDPVFNQTTRFYKPLYETKLFYIENDTLSNKLTILAKPGITEADTDKLLQKVKDEFDRAKFLREEENIIVGTFSSDIKDHRLTIHIPNQEHYNYFTNVELLEKMLGEALSVVEKPAKQNDNTFPLPTWLHRSLPQLSETDLLYIASDKHLNKFSLRVKEAATQEEVQQLFKRFESEFAVFKTQLAEQGIVTKHFNSISKNAELTFKIPNLKHYDAFINHLKSKDLLDTYKAEPEGKQEVKKQIMTPNSSVV